MPLLIACLLVSSAASSTRLDCWHACRQSHRDCVLTIVADTHPRKLFRGLGSPVRNAIRCGTITHIFSNFKAFLQTANNTSIFTELYLAGLGIL